MLPHVSPTKDSTNAHHLSGSSSSSSLQNILENMQVQISLIASRLEHITASTTSVVQPTITFNDFRPSSAHSIRVVPTFDALAEQFLSVEAEYRQLEFELDTRAQSSNNHLSGSSAI